MHLPEASHSFNIPLEKWYSQSSGQRLQNNKCKCVHGVQGYDHERKTVGWNNGKQFKLWNWF